MADAPTAPDSPWPVSRLGAELKRYIDRLGALWVEGELTEWSVRRGNVFGRLKDLETDASVPIHLWSAAAARLNADFTPGDRVIVLAKTDFWVGSGKLSMNVSELRHVGLGELMERLDRLKRQLASEGLFDVSRKRPLPFLPRVIGLITGRESDAEKDVKRNAQLRWPAVQFRTVYTAVQGERAAGEVTSALRQLDADPEVDVIIVARGGGDFETLLPFSDETLLRTAAAATTPIVSAIGHEADRPLLDEIADLRASTPTDAAKRVVPDVADELLRVQQARLRMQQRATMLVRAEIDRIGQLRSRPALATTNWIVDARAQEITRFIVRGSELAERAVERAETHTRELTARLRTLSPQSTLDRGYAIVQAAGHVLKAASDAPEGTELLLTLADGAIDAVSAGIHVRQTGPS